MQLDVGTLLHSNVGPWRVRELRDVHGGVAEVVGEDGLRKALLRIPLEAEAGERIRTEIGAAAGHPHESVLLSVGFLEHKVGPHTLPVQVLELVDGVLLEGLILVDGRLPAPAVCHVGRQVAQALVELHERTPAMAHGALSVERVLVDNGGGARLTDVGRVWPSGPARYLSPERGAGGAPSAADDLFALGVLLAEAATGQQVSTSDRGMPLIDATGLPDRLVDALGVLCAPLDGRLKNAGAAVRVLTGVLGKLEGSPGEAGRQLRTALAKVRGQQGEDDSGPRTVLDVQPLLPDPLAKPTKKTDPRGRMPPPNERLKRERAAADPRTVELGKSDVLSLDELRALAEEVSNPAQPKARGPVAAAAPPAPAAAVSAEAASSVGRGPQGTRAATVQMPSAAAPPDRDLDTSGDDGVLAPGVQLKLAIGVGAAVATLIAIGLALRFAGLL